MPKENFLLGLLTGTLLSMILVTLLIFIPLGPALAVLISGLLAGYFAGSLSKGALAGLISGALGPLLSLGLVFLVSRAFLQRLIELLSINVPTSLEGLATLASLFFAALLTLVGGIVGLVGGVIGGAIRRSTAGISKSKQATVEPPQ